MKNIRYIIMFFIMVFIIPITVNAASISLEGNSGQAVAEYTIKYTPDATPIETIKLKIVTTNDDLDYELKSDYCKPDNGKLECTLVTTTITTEATIAKLYIKNNANEKKETTVTVNATPSTGSIESVSKTFSLKGSATTTTQKAKSNSSNMQNITLSVGVLDKDFDSSITEYTVTGIKDTINSVTLTPTCDNCEFTVTCPTGGCSVSNTKKVSLEMGANNVAVNIKSEDGTSNKTYTFNIYRGDIITSSPYIKDIKIKNAVLSPKFDSLTNEYSVLLEKDLDKLDLTILPEDPEADIKIKGNEKLKVGENKIIITVTSSDGENKQVYTLLVTKEEKKTTKRVVTSKVKKQKNNKWLIILISIIALGLIIGSYLLIFNKKKKKKNKNDKNDDNKPNNDKMKEVDSNTVDNENDIVKENTDALNILSETMRKQDNEEKTDIDDALDDLMRTKKLELDDLDY